MNNYTNSLLDTDQLKFISGSYRKSENKFKITMLFCSCIISLMLLMASSVKADNDKFEWMTEDLSGLKTLFSSCLEVPEFTNFTKSLISLDLTKPDIWIATGNYLQKGKSVKFNWNIRTINANPRKYLILYRIDPRFDRPQIFVKTYNHLTKKFEASNFPKFYNNDSSKDRAALAFKKMQDYVDYFTTQSTKISVEKGDVVNITLAGKGSFFNIETQDDILTSELDSNILAFSALYINSNLQNRIIYSPAEKLCDVIDKSRKGVCSGSGGDTKYKVADNLILVGKPMTEVSVQQMINLGIKNCPSMPQDTDLVCFYDHGRGMRIMINNQIIKTEDESFVHSSVTDKSFLYYKSDIAGSLNFATNWSIRGMFTTLEHDIMGNWISNFDNINALNSYINSSDVDLSASFLHFGCYIMIVEIGNGEKTISDKQQKDIEVEYTINPDPTTPDSSVSATEISKNFIRDADKSGYLWLRVKNPHSEVQGTVVVNYTNYTGTTWFSDIVYNDIVKPIIDESHKFTMNLYSKLASNALLQRIARAMLTLYIVILGLMFVMGTVKLTATDLITRLIKIILIVILIGENSWNFFNQYLFTIFIQGTDYLITNIVGITSTKSNIFGFIDPIFDKYTNTEIWRLLFIQLLQIHNGLVFVAIMTICSLILYFQAILEVIIGYVMAFIGLSVMISLAPFFIILILFEQTKSLFDNWLSTLFNYMIQPSILLIFFLLIDQIMSEQLLKIVVRACWSELIPIEIGLNSLNLTPQNLSFKLPFLPSVSFFTPIVSDINNVSDLLNSTGTLLVIFTTSLLFCSYCLMSHSLVTYVTIIITQLTHVSPPRDENKSKMSNPPPIESVIADMKGVVTSSVRRLISSTKKSMSMIKKYTANKNSTNKNN